IDVGALHDLEGLVAASGGEDVAGLGREGGDHELADRLLVVHDEDGGPAGRGVLTEPVVEDGLVEAPLPPNLVAGEVAPLCQPVDGGYGQLEIPGHLADGQDLGGAASFPFDRVHFPSPVLSHPYCRLFALGAYGFTGGCWESRY